MDNKRSWIQAALVLAAVVLVVNQSFCRCEEKKKLARTCEYIPADVFSLDKLNTLLSYALSDSYCRPLEYKSERSFHDEKVMNLLAWTADKNKANAIVNKYSVQQLLDWTILDPDACTEEVLSERSAQCDEFNPDKAVPIDSEARIRVLYRRSGFDETSNEYAKYFHLRRYCKSSYEQFRRMCDRKWFSNAYAKVNREVLDSFREQISAHIDAYEISVQYRYSDVVKKVFKKAANAEEIKKNCAAFLKELELVQGGSYNFYGLDRGHYCDLCKPLEI